MFKIRKIKSRYITDYKVNVMNMTEGIRISGYYGKGWVEWGGR